ATLDNGVDTLVQRFLTDEVRHSVDQATSPVSAMTHHVFTLDSKAAKTDVVRTLASGTGRRILFMRTKHHAKRLARQLTAAGIPAADLHGNLSQAARDRNLAAFASGSTKVLVATDVAARGVHVDDVELVIHVDPPAEHKAYLHRSGRTARAGAQGTVVTLVLPEQQRDVNQLLRKAAIRARLVPVSATSAEVTSLVGEVAPYVAPATQPDQSRGTGPNPSRRRQNGGGAAAGQTKQGRARRGSPRGDGSTHPEPGGAGTSRRSRRRRSRRPAH
ncbi:MAG: helicase-related protein, partial [Propioniciclava sp.]